LGRNEVLGRGSVEKGLGIKKTNMVKVGSVHTKKLNERRGIGVQKLLN